MMHSAKSPHLDTIYLFNNQASFKSAELKKIFFDAYLIHINLIQMIHIPYKTLFEFFLLDFYPANKKKIICFII